MRVIRERRSSGYCRDENARLSGSPTVFCGWPWPRTDKLIPRNGFGRFDLRLGRRTCRGLVQHRLLAAPGGVIQDVMVSPVGAALTAAQANGRLRPCLNGPRARAFLLLPQRDIHSGLVESSGYANLRAGNESTLTPADMQSADMQMSRSDRCRMIRARPTAHQMGPGTGWLDHGRPVQVRDRRQGRPRMIPDLVAGAVKGRREHA